MRVPIPAPVPWVASELFLDGLSAFFLAIVFLIGFLASLYAVGYMREYDARRRGRAAPLFLNLLLLSMAFVVSAGDMLSFLLAWEGMGLASYFLVVLDHDRPESRQAGLIYLIATHIGTAGIFLAFLFLVRTTGSFSFNGFTRFPSTTRRSWPPPSGSRWWASARRRGCSRSTSGFPTPTRKPRLPFPPSCPA